VVGPPLAEAIEEVSSLKLSQHHQYSVMEVLLDTHCIVIVEELLYFIAFGQTQVVDDPALREDDEEVKFKKGKVNDPLTGSIGCTPSWRT